VQVDSTDTQSTSLRLLGTQARLRSYGFELVGVHSGADIELLFYPMRSLIYKII
jgi:hypothetical protein